MTQENKDTGERTGNGDERQQAPQNFEEAQKALAEKEKQIAELNDKYLRALAELENTRKRLGRQALEEVELRRLVLMRDLIPIVDDLERAVAAAREGKTITSIIAGLEAVLNSMTNYLRTHGVKSYEAAVGQPFDPQRHEAVDYAETKDYPSGVVVKELARGYVLEDRLLRPARVVVSKQPADEAGKS
jgi:molecular chaperone GrpE